MTHLTAKNYRAYILRYVDHACSWVENQAKKRHYIADDSMPLLLKTIGSLKTINPKKRMFNMTPVEARKHFNASLQNLNFDFPIAEQKDFIINLNHHGIKARHYMPIKMPSSVLVLYFHGGGFVLGDLDSHNDICRFICQQTGFQVIAIDYRLAPEFPFPHGLNDARAALSWVQKHANSFGVLPENVAVAGDSAGGNLAAILAQEFEHQLLANLLFYPSTDKTQLRPSAEKFAHSHFLSAADRAWFYQHYLNSQHLDSQASKNESFETSPLLGLKRRINSNLNAHYSNDLNAHSNIDENTKVKTDHVKTKQIKPKQIKIKQIKTEHIKTTEREVQQISPTVLITGGKDMLKDEGEAYALALKQCGAYINYQNVDHLDHGFLHFIGVNKTSYLAAQSALKDFKAICWSNLKH